MFRCLPRPWRIENARGLGRSELLLAVRRAEHAPGQRAPSTSRRPRPASRPRFSTSSRAMSNGPMARSAPPTPRSCSPSWGWTMSRGTFHGSPRARVFCMDTGQYRAFKVGRRSYRFQAARHLGELARVGDISSAEVTLLRVALHPEAARKIQPAFKVIFEVFLKRAAVHSRQM